MAWGLAQHVEGHAGSSPATVSLTLTAGRFVTFQAVAVFNFSGGTITVATDQGDTIVYDATDANGKMRIGHIVSAVGGSTQFTATWTGSPGRAIIHVQEWTGTPA